MHAPRPSASLSRGWPRPRRTELTTLKTSSVQAPSLWKLVAEVLFNASTQVPLQK